MTNFEELREHCEEIMAISPLRYAYIPASSIITLIDRIEKAEAELSAANEKLNKSVVLPHGTGWTSDAYNHGRNDGINQCKIAIKVAGFTVEGE